MERVDALRALIEFSQPISALSKNLIGFDWDYEGQPLVVTALQVSNVLHRFIGGEIGSNDLEEWANLIELREDLEYESQYQGLIEEVINRLANPILEGRASVEFCEKMLRRLSIQAT